MIKILFGFLLSISPIINGIYGYGYTSPPSNIYRQVGETIEIYCVLEPSPVERGHISSDNLSFSTPSFNIMKEHVHILNETAILLRIENATQMDAIITCKIDNRDGVDQNHVYVGYPPSPVEDFHCISENWQNLTCTFRRSENPIVPSFELLYGFSTSRPQNLQPTQRCSLSVDYNRTFMCKIEPDTDSALYRQTYEYYFFKLIASNELGNRSQEFVINNYDSIRPDKIINLTTSNETSDSAELSWTIPRDLSHLQRQFIFLVCIMPEYEHEWTNITYGPMSGISHRNETSKEVTVLLKNLKYAHAWYEVLISAKVAKKDKHLDTMVADLWSNFSTFSFTTASRIPDDPPRTDIGAFSINGYGHVLAYFEALPPSKHNGKNLQYLFTESSRPALIPTELTSSYAKFEDVRESDDLMFSIHSENSEGPSKLASHLRVPALHKRCPMPTAIKKIKMNTQTYVFSWQAPLGRLTKYCTEIISYTVFWCNSKNEWPNSCDGTISFERVSHDAFHFQRKSNATLNFAVSANSYNSSSGMIWTMCTALAGNDLSKLTSIEVSAVGPTTIGYRWELQCIEKSIIKGFVLQYCAVNVEKNSDECILPMQRINISANANGYNLTGLMPYTTYKTKVQMISANSSGPMSEAILKRTLEAAPTPPQNLRYRDVTNTSVVLSWDRPLQANGVLARYKIYFNEREMKYEGALTNDSIEFRLNGLKSFQEYDLLVKACTIECSNVSNAIKFKTAVGVPSIIWQPNKIDLNGQNIVRWHEPDIRAGLLQFYELRIEIKLMHDTKMHERIIRINGTQCTLAIGVCQTEELHFSVRAVNVINSVHADQEIIKHHVQQRDASNLHKRHSNPEIATDSRHSNYNFQEVQHPRAQTLDVHTNPEFNKICEEQYDEWLDRYLNADKHATMLSGNWSPKFQFACNHEASGGFYFMLVFLAIITAALCYAALIAKRKLQRMKDIGVELPAGLEDIKEENKGKNLDGGIIPRDNINRDIDLIYSSEQEQSLLRSRMESASSNSTESNSQCEYNEVRNSEFDQHNEDDSAQSLSENVDIDKLSPTPLLPISIRSLPPVPKMDTHNDRIPEPMIFSPGLMKPLTGHLVSSNNYVQASALMRPNPGTLTSNGYVTHDAIIGKPNGGYTPWSALDSKSQTESPAQTPSGDDLKTKTPVVVSTDMQGISGYVTHKQLSDFGQLMH